MMYLPGLRILYFHFRIMVLREPVASGCHSIVYYDIAPHYMTSGYDHHILLSHPWLGHESLVYMDPQCTSFDNHISTTYHYVLSALERQDFFFDSLIYKTIALILLDSFTSSLYSLL